MGNQQGVQYASLVDGTKKEGHSAELVNIKVQKNGMKLVDVPENGIDTILKGFQNTVKLTPNQPFLGTRNDAKEGRPYEWKTYQEVNDIAEDLTKGYVSLNLIPDIEGEGKTWKFMGVYAKNREEWVLTDIANMMNSVVTIAFYDTLGPSSVDFIINQTILTTISCSGNYLPMLIKLKKDGKANSIQNLVSFDRFEESLRVQGKAVGINIYTMQEVIKAGKEATSVTLRQPTKDSIYMFCYTSGTTGDPKAAMLSHGNLVAVSTASRMEGIDVTTADCSISYLPLAHSFEKCIFVTGMLCGGRYGFYSGDPLKLLDDMQALKPTIFPSVPRLFNRIYDRIQAGLSDKSYFQQWMFNRAVNSKLYYLENQAAYTHKFYDKVVFRNIRNLTGGQVRIMITGSAPISADVLSFLKVVFGCPIKEGYGQTETSAPATLTHDNDPRAGHVGGPLSCVKFRLKDIPEMGYISNDEELRGELCIKGTSVFKGYFKAPDKNAEAFDEEGWLRTGDVAMIFSNGSIKIIDRAKNIFKLSQGEYIAPEKLENVFIQSQYIQQIFVHGDSLQSYLVAIAVVEPTAIKKWVKENSLDENTNMNELLKNEKLSKVILEDLNRLATENKFSGLERVKQVHLTAEMFSIENDLLTPSLKLKRNIAKKQFDDILKELYARPLA